MQPPRRWLHIVALVAIAGACSSSSTAEDSSIDPREPTPTTSEAITTTEAPVVDLGPVGDAVLDQLEERFDADDEQQRCMAAALSDVEDLEQVEPDDVEDYTRVMAAVSGCVDQAQVAEAAAGDLWGSDAPDVDLDAAQVTCLATTLLDDPNLHAITAVGAGGEIDVADVPRLVALWRECDLGPMLAQAMGDLLGIPVADEKATCLADRVLADEALQLLLAYSGGGTAAMDDATLGAMYLALADCKLATAVIEMVGGFGADVELTEVEATCFVRGFAGSALARSEVRGEVQSPAGKVEVSRIMGECRLGSMFIAQLPDDVGLDIDEATAQCVLEQVGAIDVGPPGPAAEDAYWSGFDQAMDTCGVERPPAAG